MAPAKKTKTASERDLSQTIRQAEKDIKKAAKEVSGKIAALKKKYSQLDPQTKKKIMAGLAGLGALLVGAAAANKLKKKKK